MMQRNSKGRFAKQVDPFTTGRLVNEEQYNLSHDTLNALNRALAQAESDVKRWRK
jgi:hypothetical protein